MRGQGGQGGRGGLTRYPPPFPPLAPVVQEPPAALVRAEGRELVVGPLRADFEQTITNPMLGGPEVSHGVLYLAPPGRFAMRFGEPAGDRIVADGKWLWAYTPSTVPDQVIRQAIPAEVAS